MQGETKGTIHEGEPGFEDFLNEQMALLGQRARQRGICLDCLTDRLIVEMVANLARAEIPASDILSMVVDGLTLAEGEDEAERAPCIHRFH
ncbi:hypothetical protein [Sagittula salina]|uniref:Uncharacterized protein n=1 Tax=Sagittula salina TaxID=2820268 RepID=A0A940MLH7_9RHOB|nr:hypothetical protein [Sagittula salina]MBP0480901.1 hypothetical protein [Sagittula salina]